MWYPGRVTPGIRRFNFSSPQKRRWPQACCESLPPQSVHPLRTFQNGGDSYAERFVKKRRLYGQDRPEGCLFHSASLAEPPKVSEVCLEGNYVRVCLPTLWAGKCSQSLHKSCETCSGAVTTTGHQTYSLFRRHSNYGLLQGHCPSTCLNCCRSFVRVGLHDKLCEVSPSPFHKDGISRICGRLHHFVTRTPSGKNQECKKGVSDLTGIAASNSETTSQVTGTPYLYHSSCLSRAPPLPPLTKREKQGLRKFSNLRLHYSPFPSGQRGISLVEGQSGSMERKSSGFRFTRLRDRCLPTRLGAILQRRVHRGSMVSRRIPFPHKLFRTSSRGICCQDQDLCESQSSNASPLVNGQSDCCT